jgi:DNA-binding response OmpR family regulator
MRAYDPFRATHLPILVVDADVAAAHQLATQVRHYGFESHAAISCSAAQAALRARRYGSVVAVLNPAQGIDLESLVTLRRKAPRTWLIAVSSSTSVLADSVLFRSGIDSHLIAPFSMEDLISRILAFSQRSRPP